MQTTIMHSRSVTTSVGLPEGSLNFEFREALVAPELPLSSTVAVQQSDDNPFFSIALLIPNNKKTIATEMKRVKEKALTMQSGLAVIEKMRHSLFDYDYLDGRHYYSIRWNLSLLALSHSMAQKNTEQHSNPNRFRLDRSFVLRSLIPVCVKLKQEERLFRVPQAELHKCLHSESFENS